MLRPLIDQMISGLTLDEDELPQCPDFVEFGVRNETACSDFRNEAACSGVDHIDSSSELKHPKCHLKCPPASVSPNRRSSQNKLILINLWRSPWNFGHTELEQNYRSDTFRAFYHHQNNRWIIASISLSCLWIFQMLISLNSTRTFREWSARELLHCLSWTLILLICQAGCFAAVLQNAVAMVHFEHLARWVGPLLAVLSWWPQTNTQHVLLELLMMASAIYFLPTYEEYVIAAISVVLVRLASNLNFGTSCSPESLLFWPVSMAFMYLVHADRRRKWLVRCLQASANKGGRRRASKDTQTATHITAQTAALASQPQGDRQHHARHACGEREGRIRIQSATPPTEATVTSGCLEAGRVARGPPHASA